MRDLRAFALGAIAVAVLAYTVAAALAVTAQAADRSLHVRLGPLVVVSVETETSAAVTTFGSGLVVVALIGGVVNLGAAQLIRRRTKRRGHRVD